MNPIVLAPYDAELYGHWWYEGPEFLNYVFRKANYDQGIFKTTTPGEYLERFPTQQLSMPSASSWGAEGYYKVWLDEPNAWIYPHLHIAAGRMIELANTYRNCYGLYDRALDSHVCYPIEPEQFWKLFLPGYRDWAAEASRGASFVHLWSEAIAWSGYDFWTCPPAGSYLREAFERVGALSRFRRVATEDEVLRLMAKPIAQSQRAVPPSAIASD